MRLLHYTLLRATHGAKRDPNCDLYMLPVVIVSNQIQHERNIAYSLDKTEVDVTNAVYVPGTLQVHSVKTVGKSKLDFYTNSPYKEGE